MCTYTADTPLQLSSHFVWYSCVSKGQTTTNTRESKKRCLIRLHQGGPPFQPQPLSFPSSNNLTFLPLFWQAKVCYVCVYRAAAVAASDNNDLAVGTRSRGAESDFGGIDSTRTEEDLTGEELFPPLSKRAAESREAGEDEKRKENARTWHVSNTFAYGREDDLILLCEWPDGICR